ncbi:MAG: hypothetical protein ABIN91_15880 [Mucilaginibacter sp.]|uniref:hypothetical protein n=1 Tax=Mucilaginibacter sp. TaxID=1882438 RepID=UPI0032673C68
MKNSAQLFNLIFITSILQLLSLSVQAQIFGEKWEHGTYYTPEGKISTGLIAKSPRAKAPDKSEDYILFKTDSVSEKQWIPSSSLKSFTVINANSKIDSFTVSKATVLSRPGFIKVLLDTHTKIYSAFIGRVYDTPTMTPNGLLPGTSGPALEYLFGTSPNSLFEFGRETFIDVMCIAMADKPVVIKAIKKKQFKFNELNALIEYYKNAPK